MIPLTSTRSRPSGLVPFNFTSLPGWQMINDVDLGVVGVNNDPIGTLSGTNGTTYSWTAAGGSRPVLKTGVLNGHNVLRFDGATSIMTTLGSGIGAALSSAVTLFIVCTITDTDSYALIDSCANDSYWRFAGDGNGYNGCFRTTRVNAQPAMPTSGSHIFMLRTNSADWDLWQDGTSTVHTAADLTIRSDFNWSMGANYDGLSKFFNGDIAFIAINSNFLTDANATKVTQQLGTKYGITVA